LNRAAGALKGLPGIRKAGQVVHTIKGKAQKKNRREEERSEFVPKKPDIEWKVVRH